jgi:CHAT domain-containing protein
MRSTRSRATLLVAMVALTQLAAAPPIPPQPAGKTQRAPLDMNAAIPLVTAGFDVIAVALQAPRNQVNSKRQYVEEAIKVIESLSIDRNDLLALPMQSRQEVLRRWLALWHYNPDPMSQQSNLLNPNYLTQIFFLSTASRRGNPEFAFDVDRPEWLDWAVGKLLEWAPRQSAEVHRFLEYSTRMANEFNGAYQSEEQAALPGAAVDPLKGLVYQLRRSSLSAYETPWNCLTFYQYMESLAKLSKLYIKLGDYTRARKALLSAHLVDARGGLHQGNLALLCCLDQVLQAQQTPASLMVDRIRTEYLRLSAPDPGQFLVRPRGQWVPPAAPRSYNTWLTPEDCAWADAAAPILNSLKDRTPPETSVIILLDSLVDLNYKQGRFPQAEALLTTIIEKGVAANAQGNAQPGQAQNETRSDVLLRRSKIFQTHAMIKLAKLYQATGRFDQAEKCFENARRRLQLDPAAVPQDAAPEPGAGGEKVPGAKTVIATAAARLIATAATRLPDPFLLALRSELCEDTDYKRLLCADLASFYTDTSRFAEAEALYKRCMEERMALFGKNHPDVATAARGLAGLYTLTGRFTEAESLYQNCVYVLERERGPLHPDTAAVLTELGSLYLATGRYSQAADRLSQASRIYDQSRLLTTHPDVLICLVQIAELYLATSESLKAEPYLKRIEKILNERRTGGGFQSDRLELSVCFRTIAKLYQTRHDLDKARPYLQDVLKIRQSELGQDHPEVATSEFELAELELASKKYAQAKQHIERCVAIRDQKLGPDHPDIASAYALLGQIDEALGERDQGHGAMDRSRRSTRQYIARVLPLFDEVAQLSFLRNRYKDRLHGALALGLKDPADARLQHLCAAWAINGKAVALDALSRQNTLARDAREGRDAEAARALRDVQNALANLTHHQAVGRRNYTNQIQQVARLAEREKELVRQLGQNQGTAAPEGNWAELEQVRKRLPGDAVLVELIRLESPGSAPGRAADPPVYAAWIIPARLEAPIKVVGLGPAIPVEESIDSARKAIALDPKLRLSVGEPEMEQRLLEPLRKLARLILDPLYPHIAAYPRWYLSPDSKLWLVPWAALPLDDGRYVIERHQVDYLVSGRDLVRPREPVSAARSLVLADPDYDLWSRAPGPAQVKAPAAGPKPAEDRDQKDDPLQSEEPLAADDALRVFTGGRVPRLPMTQREALAIAPTLKQYTGVAPELLLENEAQETVFKKARSPRVLVASTHGFALGDDAKTSKRYKISPNPLLRCGLLLSGYNRHKELTRPDEDDGLLTGLEIVGTDLRGTELVVLSACETGLGSIRNGEGVMSLRQAFQIAGAHAVVASLWQVPDVETERLMVQLFENLAAGMGKAESLRQAQLTLIASRRKRFGAAHPFYWAAFTLTGDGDVARGEGPDAAAIPARP